MASHTDTADTAVTYCGDDLLSVDVASAQEAQRLSDHLRRSGAWIEAVAGIDSVVVQFDAALTDLDVAAAELVSAVAACDETPQTDAELVTIPVRYDGPDLDRVCEQTGLDRDAFIAAHTAGEYRVDMLGYTPGFAYIGELEPILDVPRLEQPRQYVDAGSIGIAGGMTGVYALGGPGGWPIVGHTDMSLFDAESESPFALAAGMRIRFEATDDGD